MNNEGLTDFYNSLTDIDLDAIDFGSMYRDLLEWIQSSKVSWTEDFIKRSSLDGSLKFSNWAIQSIYSLIPNDMYTHSANMTLCLFKCRRDFRKNTRLSFRDNNGFSMSGFMWFDVDKSRTYLKYYQDYKCTEQYKLDLEIDLSDDEFGTELLVGTLLSRIGLDIDLKLFIRMLRLFTFCHQRGIYLYSLEFNNESIVQEKLISIYERLLGIPNE